MTILNPPDAFTRALETARTAPAPVPPKNCGINAVDFALECTEPAGHRNAGWHYDEVNDVTFRPGCYLPGPDEG